MHELDWSVGQNLTDEIGNHLLCWTHQIILHKLAKARLDRLQTAFPEPSDGILTRPYPYPLFHASDDIL